MLNERWQIQKASKGSNRRGCELAFSGGEYSLEGGRSPLLGLSGSKVAAWEGVSSVEGGKDPEPPSLLAPVTLSITALP